MIRVYEVGDAWPDPYEWNIGCRWTDRETVEATGTNKTRKEDPPKPSHWKALLRTLGEFGVRTVFYTRHKDGEKRIFRHRTRSNRT